MAAFRSLTYVDNIQHFLLFRLETLSDLHIILYVNLNFLHYQRLNFSHIAFCEKLKVNFLLFLSDFKSFFEYSVMSLALFESLHSRNSITCQYLLSVLGSYTRWCLWNRRHEFEIHSISLRSQRVNNFRKVIDFCLQLWNELLDTHTS